MLTAQRAGRARNVWGLEVPEPQAFLCYGTRSHVVPQSKCSCHM